MFSTFSVKFGQGLLQKMGWEQGQALGPDSSSSKPNTEVSFHGSSGLGFDDERLDQSIDFMANVYSNSSIQNVNVSDSETTSESEPPPVVNVRRTRYARRTFSKDLANYSADDLRQIFGNSDVKNPSVVNKGECRKNQTQLPKDNPTVVDGQNKIKEKVKTSITKEEKQKKMKTSKEYAVESSKTKTSKPKSSRKTKSSSENTIAKKKKRKQEA
ncbi:hypothetical protein P9112_000808 [Eukaryota sp. TZLM1-RC]